MQWGTALEKRRSRLRIRQKWRSSFSSLHNLYQSFPSMQLMTPYQPQGYNYGCMSNPFHQGYRPQRRLNHGGSKPIGPYPFCKSMCHLIKDFLKLKAMQQYTDSIGKPKLCKICCTVKNYHSIYFNISESCIFQSCQLLQSCKLQSIPLRIKGIILIWCTSCINKKIFAIQI